MAQERSAPDAAEDTRTGTPAGDGQDEIPDEIRSMPEGPARKWAFAGYERARQARAEVDRLSARAAELQEDLRHREELVTKLAIAPRAGEVKPEHTERAGERKYEYEPLEFDPFAQDAKQQLEAYIDRRLAVEARKFVDWYTEDRQQLWRAQSEHSTRLAGMTSEFALLFRDHPELRLEDMQKLWEEAPRHNFSVEKAYEEVYRGDIEKRREAKIREEVEAEVRGKMPQPTMPAPPVIGGGGPVPRRSPTNAPRPRTWTEATRMATRDSQGKLLR